MIKTSTTSMVSMLICLSLCFGFFLIQGAEANQHDLCACSLPARCEAGKGCLVKKGDCTTDSCPFPRLSMCDMTIIQAENTVTCGVMGNGWDVCVENTEVPAGGTRVMKPRPVYV